MRCGWGGSSKSERSEDLQQLAKVPCDLISINSRLHAGGRTCNVMHCNAADTRVPRCHFLNPFELSTLETFGQVFYYHRLTIDPSLYVYTPRSGEAPVQHLKKRALLKHAVKESKKITTIGFCEQFSDAAPLDATQRCNHFVLIAGILWDDPRVSE